MTNPSSSSKQPALTSSPLSPKEQKALDLRRKSPTKFRLLPLTLMMLTLMLGVRIHDLYHDGSKLRDMMFPTAEAEEKDGKGAAAVPPAEKAAVETKPEETKTAQAAPDAAKKDEKPAEAGKDAAQAAKEGGKKEGDKKEGEATATADSPDIKLAKLSDQPGLSSAERKHDYSNIELDILQSLAQRRDKLEERSKEVDLKEKLLEATEMRINDKVSEIKSLKVEVQKLLDEYNTKEKAKVQGLVKIYENMKPKDAAQIFNELEMPILLEVVDQMSARKVAPVLANMDPMRAKDVTRELSEYRKLREIPKNISQK